MSQSKSEIETLIQNYMIDEGILREKITNPKLDFGYIISFPPGLINGHKLHVFKPKNKDFIIISIGTQISKQHIDALNSLGDKKMHFFMSLRKAFLLKDVFFRIDIENHRYEISDQIFLNKNAIISKNSIFKSIRRVFNCAIYGNMILGDYCLGKVKPEDFTKTKDFTSGSDFSLYS